MKEIYIEDLKTKDIIQVFERHSLRLELYKILEIYKSEGNKRIFECQKMKFTEKKELVETIEICFINENDVYGIYNKVKRK